MGHLSIGNTLKTSMRNLYIKISTDYSFTPGVRFEHQGEFSGETFRKNILEPKFIEALASGVKVIVDVEVSCNAS